MTPLLLAVQVGCPGYAVLDAFAFVGFVTVIALTGLGLIVVWELYLARGARREGDG